MFKLLRLAILLLVAFVAGIVFERGQQEELCRRIGGDWDRDGVCTESAQ